MGILSTAKSVPTLIARLNHRIFVVVGAKAGIGRRCGTQRFHGNGNADLRDVKGDQERYGAMRDPVHCFVDTEKSTV